MKIVGRNREVILLLEAINSSRSHLIAVYGRRRIGKTFLISEVYKKYIKFEVTGLYKVPLKEQLQNFSYQLGKKLKVPSLRNWIEAFHFLEKYMDSIKASGKKVIFIDEFPWLDSHKSGFLLAFAGFWNSYASRRDDLIVIVCGSAASYMIKNIIKSKGGLHNRITEKISLQPFSLAEAELLLKRNKVSLTREDVLKIYMSIGGIPSYLEKIRPGESVSQNLDRLCFNKDGFLNTEFSNIFSSLFDQPENHETIIRALAGVRKGLTRNDINRKTGISTGGTLTKNLIELQQSGFIENYTPYRGRKNSLFRLSDEYSLFYLKFIDKAKNPGFGYWATMEAKPAYKSWLGFTFETVVLKHVQQLRHAMGIQGVRTVPGSWVGKTGNSGAQIDLLLDRDDNVINICEIKFYSTEFEIDKRYANELIRKMEVFKNDTKTRKNVWLTFITSHGVRNNKYKTQLVKNELTLNDLFGLT